MHLFGCERKAGGAWGVAAWPMHGSCVEEAAQSQGLQSGARSISGSRQSRGSMTKDGQASLAWLRSRSGIRAGGVVCSGQVLDACLWAWKRGRWGLQDCGLADALELPASTVWEGMLVPWRPATQEHPKAQSPLCMPIGTGPANGSDRIHDMWHHAVDVLWVMDLLTVSSPGCRTMRRPWSRRGRVARFPP